MRILLASASLTEAITHLHLFRSSSHDSQNVSVELSLRLATMATRLDTFKSREAVMSIRPSTVVSASLKRPQGTAPLLSNSSDLEIYVYTYKTNTYWRYIDLPTFDNTYNTANICIFVKCIDVGKSTVELPTSIPIIYNYYQTQHFI